MKYLVEKYTLPRQEEATFLAKAEEQKARVVKTPEILSANCAIGAFEPCASSRSEERRVGKECRL